MSWYLKEYLALCRFKREKQNNFPNKTHNSQLIQPPFASFEFGDQGSFVTTCLTKNPSSFTTNTTKQNTPPGEDAHVSQDPH